MAQRHQRVGNRRSANSAQHCDESGDVRQLRGRAEIADAAAAIARLAAAGRLDPDRVDERTIAKHLDEPDMPDVDLFIRSSGEQRTSNFLLWQAAYAEMVFLERLWPDFDRRDFWQAVEMYVDRDRRYGGAQGPAV